MQGCLRSIMALALAAAAGCRERTESEPAPPARVELGASFDVKTTGTIQGCVTWQGELPAIPRIRVHSYLDYANAGRLRGEYPNPHHPQIDAETRGVGGVVLYLRKVNASQSKPWSHEPVHVETDSENLIIVQGKQPASIGFVRRGDEATFTSRDTTYHAVRGRGADFFTLPFVAADQPTRRRLNQAGIVELSEAAGLYWRRAYLFVMEHPYAVLSDSTGKFALDQVPAGAYQLTAWLPNWRIDRKERDPETAIVSRVMFAPAVEVQRTVAVRAGATTEAAFAIPHP